MRKITMLLILGLWSAWASAQGREGGGREPAGNVGREPAGAKSGREGGGGADKGGSGGESKVKDKPGKSSVSPDAVKTADAIKSANSVDGNGNTMTKEQQKEVERQLSDQRTAAEADGRRADANFFEKEKEKIKKN
jgi:hypothetical protein